MTLSKQQKDLSLNRYQKYFWIHERDLLWCARKHIAWEIKANQLGFTDAKIDAPWEHKDAGKLINYMENPFFQEKTTVVEKPLLYAKVPDCILDFWKRDDS